MEDLASGYVDDGEVGMDGGIRSGFNVNVSTWVRLTTGAVAAETI